MHPWPRPSGVVEQLDQLDLMVAADRVGDKHAARLAAVRRPYLARAPHRLRPLSAEPLAHRGHDLLDIVDDHAAVKQPRHPEISHERASLPATPGSLGSRWPVRAWSRSNTKPS